MYIYTLNWSVNYDATHPILDSNLLYSSCSTVQDLRILQLKLQLYEIRNAEYFKVQCHDIEQWNTTMHHAMLVIINRILIAIILSTGPNFWS
jgi:hypothetical protein